MAIPQRFLEELKNRLTLSEVIGKRITIKRAGREYKACCPFHKETTPSFTINDDKQFYHCFGCGAHGSVIDFVMEYDNLSFPDAVENLAGMAGMQVPKQNPIEAQRAKQQKDLYSLMDEAAKLFQEALKGAPREYILQRGLSEDSLANFRVGFAPNDGQAIRKALQARGYKDQQMLEVGLLKESTRGGDPYIFFRERIMFPVLDRRGRVVAFGGRVLPEHLREPTRSDFKPPKYINTAETVLFDKGRMLYGEPQARQAAAEGHTLIVVEGYMDVIACHQGGFKGAVAPMGTALTEDQIPLLWTMGEANRKADINAPVLCFDGDNAGRRAASRAVDNVLPLLGAGRSVRFAFLPEGQDPDSMIKQQGRAALQSFLKSAYSLFDFIWNAHVSGRDFSNPEARAGVIKTLKNEIAKVADNEVQVHYNALLQTKIQETFFARKELQPRTHDARGMPSGRGHSQMHKPMNTMKLRRAKRDAGNVIEAVLLAAVINHPHIFHDVEEQLGQLHFQSQRTQNLYYAIVTALHDQPALDSQHLCTTLEGQGHGKEIRDICSESVYLHGAFARPGECDRVLSKWLEVFQTHQMRHETAERKLSWKSAVSEADEDKLERLRKAIVSEASEQ